MARELRRIDEQDALDALSVPPDEADLETLLEVDDNWRDLPGADRSLVVDLPNDGSLPGLNVGQLPAGDRVVRMVLIEVAPNQTLIPLDRFIGTMVPALDLPGPRGVG